MASHDPAIHISKKSSNTKVGAIPVSTTEESSCPRSCPYINSGCYARQGPIWWHWKKVTNKTYNNLVNWSGLCKFIAELPDKQPMRLNQSGDMPHLFGDLIPEKMQELKTAAEGRLVWSYTHHKKSKKNLAILKDASSTSLTIRVSCETLDQVDEVMDQGLSAALVISSDHPSAHLLADGKHWGLKSPIRSSKGRLGVLCPAQRFESSQCQSCLLCPKVNKNTFIIFIAHGTQAKKVNEVLKNLPT